MASRSAWTPGTASRSPASASRPVPPPRPATRSWPRRGSGPTASGGPPSSDIRRRFPRRSPRPHSTRPSEPLGRSLPADLRALYLIADGDGFRYLTENYAWLSLQSLVAEYTDWREWQDRPWFGWDLEWDAVVFDGTPADTVRRCGGHPGWIRFATGEDGNFLAVDMAPARDGRPGQVIATGRDFDEGPEYVADSITSLLGQHLELLDKGRFEKVEDHIHLRLPDDGGGTRQIIGDIPAEVPPTLQAIHVNDVSGIVDLAPLTAAPALRLLHLNRCTTADPTPLRGLTVESLRIALVGGDLTPLSGHPHPASLALRTTTPVDVAPLRTSSNLRGLDLPGADVTDLSVLVGLPSLRYLALTQRQWTALLESGEEPSALAAARLAGDDVDFADALDLAARLGLATDGAPRAAGTL
ncbi:SMI1/KNR4 family protein [Streptomyces sp. JJ38]|uniref:SMI1/KNR4 family protein n=1 Tax=Streptomyces sp. JJ38 TaxID=2738128 RepID=UPI0027E0CFA3|nr:SMI1/KNR4 family protein [Streptomyces sp. JJ38]